MKTKNYFVSGSVSQTINKDEFVFLVNQLDRSKLIKPIVAVPKEFKKETKGFRINKLPTEIICRIYYYRLFKFQDRRFEEVFSNLIEALLTSIDLGINEQIATKEDDFSAIRTRLTGVKTDYFIRYVDGLLNTCFVDRIFLFFKLISVELDEKSSSYLEIKVEEKKKILELEKKYAAECQAEVEARVAKIETDHNQVVGRLKGEIKKLKENDRHIQENHRKELSSKDKENAILRKSISDLREDNNKLVDQKDHQIDHAQKIVDALRRENEVCNCELIELRSKLAMKDDKFKEIAYDKWLDEHEKQVMEKAEAEHKVQQLTEAIDDLEEKVKNLQCEKSRIEEMNGKLEKNTSELIEGIKAAAQMLGLNESEVQHQVDLTVVDGRLCDEEVEETDDITDFIYDLQTNLETVGIEEDLSSQMAKYICSSIILGKNILLIGNNPKEIANALSNVYCASDSAVITVPYGYSDINFMNKAIDALHSEVILIENLLDNSFESAYYPVMKNQTSKILIFSLESPEMIKLLPSGILGYLSVLNVDNCKTFKRSGELFEASVTKDIFEKEIEYEDKKEAYNNLQGLKKKLKLSRAVMLEMANLTAVLRKLGSESDSLLCIIVFCLSIWMDDYSDREAYLDIFADLELKEMDIRKLKLALELGDE